MQDVETTAQVIGSIPPSVTAKVAKIGPYGAGKSTNIDSIASALTGRVEKPAGAGHGASTLTINSTIHNLRYLLNPDARPTYQLVNVSVLDTPGSYFEVRFLHFVASSLDCLSPLTTCLDAAAITNLSDVFEIELLHMAIR